MRASHPELGDWLLTCEDSAELLFCENETNNERLFGTPNVAQHVKDGINDYVVNGAGRRRQPGARGHQDGRAAHARARAGPERQRAPATDLRDGRPDPTRRATPLGSGFDRVIGARRQEADEFYATVVDPSLGADAGNVMRQSLAGMLWGKQYFEYDVHTWLSEHGVNPWSVHAQDRACATRRGSTSWPVT